MMFLCSRNANLVSDLFLDCGVMLTLVVLSGLFGGCFFSWLFAFIYFVLYFNNIQWKIKYLLEINMHQITRGILSHIINTLRCTDQALQKYHRVFTCKIFYPCEIFAKFLYIVHS